MALEKVVYEDNVTVITAAQHIKFCVKGVGANLTATLTPK